jgi:predicted acylesterase/phospholipase RssA
MRLAQILKVFVQRVLVPFHWLFVRLPKPFSLPLLGFTSLYFFFLFPLLVNASAYLVIYLTKLAKFYLLSLTSGHGILAWLVSGTAGLIFVDIVLIISALLTLLFAVAGILMSHWVAAKIYKIYRRFSATPFKPFVPVHPQAQPNGDGVNNPLARYKKIGIILSGGGAKGAYQAGAMRAIYEFLEEHNAHTKVQMIAGTSIGSWNALFWLADLIKSQTDGPGPLEQWWRQVNVQNIILPIRYVPTRQNYLLSNQPWRDNFDAVFIGTAAGQRLLYHAQQPYADDAIRFYFTHSNIGKAHLAFTTNRGEWESVTPNLPRSRPVVAPGTYVVVNDANDESRTLEKIRTGVFSSMDIPPLFPYTSINDEFFEDGGVIDNLPIRFGTEIEECDLLFILPLNASFERTVDQRSLIRRLARVTEIRQGVLERNSFKMIYLYNELASLREKIISLEPKQTATQPEPADIETAPQDRAKERIAARALARTHHIVDVFSVCPAPELRIGTTEFWKTKEAGEAFQFMYEVTKNELKEFTDVVGSNQIRMALVSPVPNVAENGDGLHLASKNDSQQKESADEVYPDGAKPILKTTDSVTYNVTYFREF